MLAAPDGDADLIQDQLVVPDDGHAGSPEDDGGLGGAKARAAHAVRSYRRPGLACARQGCAVAAAAELDAGAEGVTLGAGDGDTAPGAEDDGAGVGAGVVTPGEGLCCRLGATGDLLPEPELPPEKV